MVFRVAGDLDAEPVAGRLADEADELARVAQLPRRGDAGGQVAAQRDEVADAVRAVALELLGEVLARRGDAGEMRRRLVPGGADLEHRFRACLRGSSRRRRRCRRKTAA